MPLSKEQYQLDRLCELHDICNGILSGGGSIIAGSRVIPNLLRELKFDEKVDSTVFVGIDSETDHLPYGQVRELWDTEALAKLEHAIEESERWALAIGKIEVEKILNLTGRIMFAARHPDAQTVQAVLGEEFNVVEFLASTKSSADAAATIGCEVGQIAKSIVFKTAKEQKPVLVIASGVNRVDEKKVSAVLGEKVKSADAEFVMANAGVAPGGVPPVGHKVAPIIVLDQDLQQYAEIWAAAGTPNAVFKLTWRDLQVLTNGIAADVAKR